MWAVIGVVTLGLVWWTREESASPSRSAPVSPPRTTAEKWSRELTEKILTNIHTNDDRPLLGQPIPRRQILCCVVTPESWDGVTKEFKSFCLREEGLSDSDPETRQVAKWAESVLKMIQTIDGLNETRRALQNKDELWEAERVLGQIREVVHELTGVLKKQLQSTKDSEVEVYEKYFQLLKKISHTNYWSALLTFLSSGSSMSETSPQILVNTSQRTRDDDKSEEEGLTSLVTGEKTRRMIGAGVIEATGQRTMKKTVVPFGSSTVRFSTGFTHRVTAPDSPRAKAFREAMALTAQEVNQDAMERTRARTTWPNRQGQAYWSEASATQSPVRRASPDPILRDVDKFLENVK